MAVNPLTPKELRATCNAALAVIDDFRNRLPKLDVDFAEEVEDAEIRLQAIVDASNGHSERQVQTRTIATTKEQTDYDYSND